MTKKESEKYSEVLADIAYNAWPFVMKGDSITIRNHLIEWAKEFARFHVKTDWTEIDYLETIDMYALEKITAYNKNFKE